MTTGPAMQQLAEKTFRHHHVLQETEQYQIFEIPAGFFDHNVLFLWKTGHDGPLPGGFLIELTLDNRPGCFCHKDSQFPK